MYSFWTDPHSPDDSKIKRLIETCGDLMGLDCFDDYDHEGSDIEISLLRAIGHRLHFLRINISDSNQIASLKNVNFANLRQLRDGNGTVPSIQAILKSAINLEKVSFDDKSELIVETLTKCKRLRYLELHRMCDMTGILEALESGLFQTKKLQRDTFKVRINMPPSYIPPSERYNHPIANPQECVIKLDRIINSLSVNNVDQWMIIFDISGDQNEFVKGLLGSLAADVATIHVHQDVGGDIVLITNPGCTICGWRESWLMGSG